MIFEIFDEDWAQTFSTLEDTIFFFLLYLIFLIAMVIFLKIALSLFSSARYTEFGYVLLTSFVITVIYALTFLFINCWVEWVIVIIAVCLLTGAIHNTSILGVLVAILYLFVIFVNFVIVTILFGILLGVTLIVLPF